MLAYDIPLDKSDEWCRAYVAHVIYPESKRGERGAKPVSLQTAILFFVIECNRFSPACSIDKVLVRFPVIKRGYQDWSDCCILSIVL